MSLLSLVSFSISLIAISLAYSASKSKQSIPLRNIFILVGINFFNLFLIQIGHLTNTLNFFGCYALLYGHFLNSIRLNINKKPSMTFYIIISSILAVILYQHLVERIYIYGFDDIETLPGLVYLIFNSLLGIKQNSNWNNTKFLYLGALILGFLALAEFTSSGLRLNYITISIVAIICLVSFVWVYTLLLNRLSSKDWINNTKKYSTSTLSDSDKFDIWNSIKCHLEKNKPYLNPNYSLEFLSRDLQLKARHLSEVMNTVDQKNFLELINTYRVKEAIRIMHNDGKNLLSIKHIMYECGFKSKSSFYRYFRQSQKMTPEEYRKGRK